MKYLVNTVHISDEAPEDAYPYAYIVEADDIEEAVEKVKAQLVQEEIDLLDLAFEKDEEARLREHGFEAISYNDIGSGQGFIITEPIELGNVLNI